MSYPIVLGDVDPTEIINASRDLPGLVPGWALFAILVIAGGALLLLAWVLRYTISTTLPGIIKDSRAAHESISANYRADIHKLHDDCAKEKLEQRTAYFSESKLERDLFREDLNRERLSRENTLASLESAIRSLHDAVRDSHKK